MVRQKQESNIVLLPSLERRILKINDKKQLELILKAKEKIRIMGEKAMKILYSKGNYKLGEIKYKRPPYRLYIIYDQNDNTFYLTSWAHKKSQDRIIEKMKKDLKEVLAYGIENLL